MYEVILLLQAGGKTSSDALTELWTALPWHNAKRLVRHLHNWTIPGAMPIENAPAATMDTIDQFWFIGQRACERFFRFRCFRRFLERPLCGPAVHAATGAVRRTAFAVGARAEASLGSGDVAPVLCSS